MSIEWTAAEREAVASTLGCKPSAHDAACLTHNMPGNWGNRGHWMDESNDILAALAPFVAERERQAAARALYRASNLAKSRESGDVSWLTLRAMAYAQRAEDARREGSW